MAGTAKRKKTVVYGRPTVYREKKHVPLCAKWAAEGLNREQIAKKLGIARSTLVEWAKVHPAFSEALATGCEIADERVENALYRRALGFVVTESEIHEIYAAPPEEDTTTAQAQQLSREIWGGDPNQADDAGETAEPAPASAAATPKPQLVRREVTRKRKLLPPDVGAAKTWLRNRQPKKWQERTTLDLAGTVNVNLGEWSQEDLRAAVAVTIQGLRAEVAPA